MESRAAEIAFAVLAALGSAAAQHSTSCSATPAAARKRAPRFVLDATAVRNVAKGSI